MLGKKKHKTINIGEKSTYVEANYGVVNNYQGQSSSLSEDELLMNISSASVDLSCYENKFQGEMHIDRKETKALYYWITNDLIDASKISLLVGNAGYGKSVVLKDLFDLLSQNNIPSLGIKADKILNIGSIKDIEAELSLSDNIYSIFRSLSKSETIVLIIDQIDALSQSLSSSRHAINSYDRLIRRLDTLPNVRIIISCRTYDLDYDPVLRSYKKNNTIKLSLLEIEQVLQVLSHFQITVDINKGRLIEFLRIPLHLNLFCKVGVTKQFDDNISLQKLYDEIWIEFVERSNVIDSERIIEALSIIAQKMNELQRIVVDKRLFSLYNKELNYLFHHDLLKESTSDDKIQFIHQTFFDYIYARTFLTSGKSITVLLRNSHQGLFIRSQVKQIFSYLRDLDTEAYINELKTLLLGKEFRFHLKLLVLSDLGFYCNPTNGEKKFVLDCIVKDQLFFQMFLESINSIKWFEFVITQKEFNKLLMKNEDKADWIIAHLCNRLIGQSPHIVIDFLSKNTSKIKIIESVLINIPESEIALSYDLYKNTIAKWGIHVRGEYIYLDKALNADPDFVISELKKEFDENIPKIDRLSHDYIPGGYSALEIYKRLFEKYPNKAITYFLYIIERIVVIKQYESICGLFGDFAFYLYRPNPDNNECQESKGIYDLVLYSIKHNLLDDNSKCRISNLLTSKYANVLSIGIFYLLQNVKTEYKNAYDLLCNEVFLKKIRTSEILEFYSKELLSAVYPLLLEEEQKLLNQSILSTQNTFNHWTHETDYTKNKVRSNYLLFTFGLLSNIPVKYVNQHKEIKKVYQEGYRKYGNVENVPPQEVTTTMGWKTYKIKAYEKMTLNDWKNTFLKLCSERNSVADWDKPTKEGNKRQFEAFVAKEAEKFYPFIDSLINSEEIDVEYITSGLEGLEKAKYSKRKYNNLCLNLINKREEEFNEMNLYSLLRVLRYCIRSNKNLDKRIFDFIKKIIHTYEDKKFSPGIIQRDDGMDVVQAGINSIRGMAVELIVECYNMVHYKDEIFEILEFIADNANEITRSCVIFNGAWLNILDKDRALDLYLKLHWDYNPHLLAIPCHDGHPLLYHVSVNFKKLEEFFSKAINIEEAGKPMAMFLLKAYLNNKSKSYTLIKKLLVANTYARQDLAWYICVHLLKNKRHSTKGWRIMNFLLHFDDKELGEKINHCFLHMPTQININLISFLDKYVKSPIGKYRDNYFYDFLRKIIPSDSHHVLKWFFDSNPEGLKRDFYDKSPINVLIESYNGIREYEKDDPLLEKAMDMFDSLLKIQEYRNVHLRTFLKELSA
jgi:hypothetical protein